MAQVSADKMMIKARGPVWHKKQRVQNLVPAGLHGLDKEALWSYSRADGWVYGHGSFCFTSHQIPVLGRFIWMPNSAHEAKRMQVEMAPYAGTVGRVFMDSKADDHKIYFGLQRDHNIQLVTVMRKNTDKSRLRQQMKREMLTPQNVSDYKRRSTTVEPMQALVKDLFALETCWMRGNKSNRWLFAAMGVAVQIAQRIAYLNQKSTWNIKQLVLGT